MLGYWLDLYKPSTEPNKLTMKTKNKILTIAMVALLSLTMHQQAVGQTGRMGVKGGLNVSNLYIDNVTDRDPRLGFHLGLYGQIFSTDRFAIQPELLFSTKGATAQYGGPINQEISYNFSYIDVPVLAVIKLGSVGEIHLGCYASYLLGANISHKSTLSVGVEEIDKDNLKSYDYGLAAGMGINFGRFQIGARYNYGLVKLAKNNAARVLIGDAKNSYLQLYASVNLQSQ